jgi:putative von willebrand factor type A domain protein
MTKSLTLLTSFLAPCTNGVLRSFIAICLLGVGTQLPAQTRVASEKVTSNLHQRVKLLRSVNGGQLYFDLAPELPSRVEREHWPIIFYTTLNDEGEEVQVMQNMISYTSVNVDIPAGKNEVNVAGEDGIWGLEAYKAKINALELETPALRLLSMRNNELHTPTEGAGRFILPTLPNLENLDVSHNNLTKLDLNGSASSLKRVIAVGNGLVNEDYSGLSQLTVMNLQGNKLEQIKVPTSFVPQAQIFSVSPWQVEQPDLLMKYAEDLANLDINNYDVNIFQNLKSELDLSVNNLKISTLPKVPVGLDMAVDGKMGYTNRPRFNVAAQRRFVIPQTEYKLQQEIDLSSELKAYAQDGTEHKTQYIWYVEKDAGTDQYEEVNPADYEVVNGVTKFKRGFGRDAKIFAMLYNKAFDTSVRRPEQTSTDVFKVGLSSFEPNASAGSHANGYMYTTEQPSGNPYIIRELSEWGPPHVASYEAELVGAIFFNITPYPFYRTVVEDARPTQDGDRARFYRTNVITLKGNYWYGFEDNVWNNEKNWTMRYVPPTTPDAYAALTDKSEANVEFATKDNYGSNAIRDLWTDGVGRVVQNYINYSPKALAVQPATQLIIKNEVKGRELYDGDFGQAILRVKGGYNFDSSNGTLIVESQKPAEADVELATRSHSRGNGLLRAGWQYFGVPVDEASEDDDYNKKSNVFGNETVRKYNRTLQVPNSDEKWEALASNELLKPGVGYEITTATPSRYTFKGKLIYGNGTDVDGSAIYNFPIDGSPVGTNYDDINILGNPFTAAMDISKFKYEDDNKLVKTFYLFNTGSRENWLARDGANTTGDRSGQYTAAIPAGLAGYVEEMPSEIPSLSSFAVKANAQTTISYRYKDVMKSETANRARRRDVEGSRVASLMVDVASEKSMDRLWLVEHEEATDAFDNGFDGEKMLSAGAAQLYAEESKNLQVKTTNRLKRTDLSFVPADKAGRYELKFHLKGFKASDEFVLLDKRTGEETPINDGDKYSFVADVNDKPQRFAILRKGSSMDSAAEAGFTVVADAQRNIEVVNATTESGDVLVVDAAGKSIARFKLAAGARKSVQVNIPGVYVVKAENAQSRLSQSVLVP